jgi:hypothetical protein
LRKPIDADWLTLDYCISPLRTMSITLILLQAE